MKGGQSASQPVLVSTAVSDPSADWDLIELDDEEEEGDGTEETGNGKNESFQDAEHRLIEYDTPVNVDAMNSDFIKRSHEVWDTNERDRWIYNLENDEGFVPNFQISKRNKK